MNESDEFRQQVEELKQRLGSTQAQHESQAGALTQRLTSIKASLRQKQEEITRLSAENQQLRIMLDEVIAMLNRREELESGAMVNGFFDEISELIENEQSEAIPPLEISAPPQPSAWSSEEKPAEPESGPSLPAEPSAAAEIKPESPVKAAPAEESETAAPTVQAEAAPQDPEKEEEQEEVPALKRILKRGQRGR